MLPIEVSRVCVTVAVLRHRQRDTGNIATGAKIEDFLARLGEDEHV